MKLAILVLAVLAASAVFSDFSVQAGELPDFSSWAVIHSGKEDYSKDGIDDVVFKFLSEHSDLNESFASALLFYFQPFDTKRIDMAIIMFFTRTNEPGKNTILSVRFHFYARQGDKILAEGRIAHRPKNIQKVIKEPMFKEDSLFGRRWFAEWRKFGLTDDEIRQKIPKWGWLPED